MTPERLNEIDHQVMALGLTPPQHVVLELVAEVRRLRDGITELANEMHLSGGPVTFSDWPGLVLGLLGEGDQ